MANISKGRYTEIYQKVTKERRRSIKRKGEKNVEIMDKRRKKS
jgi:hypothetical protein